METFANKLWRLRPAARVATVAFMMAAGMACGSVFAMWKNGELPGMGAASCAAIGLGYIAVRIFVEGAIVRGVDKAGQHAQHGSVGTTAQVISTIAMIALIASAVLTFNMLHALQLEQPFRQLSPLAVAAGYAGVGGILIAWR